MTTLSALRDVVCVLRGRPAPLGVASNTADAGFLPDGRCTDPRIQAQLEAVAGQVAEFAGMRRSAVMSGAASLAPIGG